MATRPGSNSHEKSENGVMEILPMLMGILLGPHEHHEHHEP